MYSLRDLFIPGLFLADDTEAQVARLVSFYASLSEGNIIPRWGRDLNYGFGHPVLMFLYPLPMYFGSLIHSMGWGFIDSVKIVLGIGFAASGLAMYLWIKEIYGARSGFIAGLLYTIAPYRFLDLYGRGALGENTAFIFAPLVCYFLYKKNLIGVSLSIAGLVMSHNALSLMFLIFIIPYGLYLNPSFLFSAFFFGFSLSAFYWMPGVFEGKYTLRDIVIDSKLYLTRFPSLEELLFGKYQIGVLHLLTILLLFRTFLRKNKAFSIMVIAVFLLTVFLLHPLSANLSFLAIFQFPWRWLSLTVFVCAVAGGLVLSSIKKGQTLLTIILTIMVLYLYLPLAHIKGINTNKDNYFIREYTGTTDTGESSPIWGTRGQEEAAKQQIEIIDGYAQISNIVKKSNLHTYIIRVDKPTYFKDNTMYFPGWKVFANGQDIPIEYQNKNYRGIITFHLPVGNYEMKTIFTETKTRLFADIISGISLIIFIATFFYKRFRNNTIL